MPRSDLPSPADEIWFRPKWTRPGRVGHWHLLAASQTLPGGKAVCGYGQWYNSGFETVTRSELYDQARICDRCVAALNVAAGR